MRKIEIVDRRQQKIDQILALMTGKLKPADIDPRMVIHFNTDCGGVYLVNNKQVDKKTFDALCSTLPANGGSFITHGREDNDEEYYYGEVPFSIYKDGSEFLNKST